MAFFLGGTGELAADASAARFGSAGAGTGAGFSLGFGEEAAAGVGVDGVEVPLVDAWACCCCSFARRFIRIYGYVKQIYALGLYGSYAVSISLRVSERIAHVVERRLFVVVCLHAHARSLRAGYRVSHDAPTPTHARPSTRRLLDKDFIHSPLTIMSAVITLLLASLLLHRTLCTSVPF